MGTTTQPAAAASTSTTAAAAISEKDVEGQNRGTNRVSHFSLVFNPSGLTPEVLEHAYPGHGTAESPYVVDFLPRDARNPMQFAPWRKWVITALQAIATLAVAFASTAYSGGIMQVIHDFHISTELAIVGISLFVVGFAVGPLLWAPLSEFYGRQIIFFTTYAVFTAFNAGGAGAQNIQTLIILRFFAGSFGSSPLTNSGGVIADIFSANERGMASGVFATAPFLGPAIGPIVGGFLGAAEGWRWVQGVTAIFTGVLWIACVLFVPETYAPVLLRKRAAELRKVTGKFYVSKVDASNWEHRGRKGEKMKQIKTAMVRPWVLLFSEPIVFLTSIYMAIVYGTLYMLFAAFPIVFQQYRGWSAGVGGLAFIGVAVGVLIAVLYCMYDNKRYMRVAAAHGGVAPPEARLFCAMIGSVLLPVGLFWFAWTNSPSVHWIVPIIASGFFACGLVLVFLSLMTYLIDSYTVFAASVLASNSVLRSLFGAAFPLFTTYMYKDLGIHWASTIPAFLALACMPFPFLFYRYGAAIRMRCKYASEAATIMARMRGAAAAGAGAGPTEPLEVITEDQAEAEAEINNEIRKTASRASRASRRNSHARMDSGLLSRFMSNRSQRLDEVPREQPEQQPQGVRPSSDDEGTIVGNHTDDELREKEKEKERGGSHDNTNMV